MDNGSHLYYGCRYFKMDSKSAIKFVKKLVASNIHRLFHQSGHNDGTILIKNLHYWIICSKFAKKVDL